MITLDISLDYSDTRIKLAKQFNISYNNNVNIEISTDELNCNKSPLLFIHGLGTNRLMLRELALNIHNLTERSICLIDLRGHGDSYLIDSPEYFFTQTVLMQDIIFVINYLQNHYSNWKNNLIDIISHSYGCNIALNVLTSQSMKLINNIICIDGGYINLKSVYNNFNDCRKSLEPPNFTNHSWKDIESTIRGHWCTNWTETAIQSMLFNFYMNNGVICTKLSYMRHIQLLHDLWCNPCNNMTINESSRYPKIYLIGLSRSKPTKYSINKENDMKILIDHLVKHHINVQLDWLDDSHDMPTEKPEVLAKIISVILN